MSEPAVSEDAPIPDSTADEGGSGPQAKPKAEPRYEQLFNSVTDGLFQTDLQGNFTHVNPAFASMFGYTPEEILGGHHMFWREQLSEEQIEQILEKIAERGEIKDEMLIFLRKDGAERCISVSLSRQTDELGETTGYAGMAIDITDRERYKTRLEVLHAHTSNLDRATNVVEIAELTFDTIEQVLGFNLGSFSIVEGDILREIHKRGVESHTLIKMPLGGRGITVRAANTGETQLIHDVREDEDYIPGTADASYRALSELDVPVKVDDKVNAVINVESTMLNAFTAEDRSLLETLAGHVASTMQKIRLLESERLNKAKLEALHRHSSELASAMTIEEVAESTMKAIEYVLGFPLGDFNVVEGDMLVPVHVKGIRMGPYEELPLTGPGIIVRAYKTGRSQLVTDTREDEDYLPVYTAQNQQTLSELAVPVIVGSEVKVVINLESDELGAYTDEDRKLVETLAQHVSSAIDRLEKTEQLRESERKFRTLIDISSDAVSIVVGTTVVYANETLADLLGYDNPSELVGMSALDLAAPEDREMIRTRALGRQRGEEHPEQYAFKMLRSDGTTVDVENLVKVIEYEGRPASYSLVRDITKRKQMERVLKKYAEHLEDTVEERTKELKEAERMATIGELAAMVGHDLRNPLTSIAGATYFLKTSRGTTDEAANKMFETIENDISYSNKIINDLLDYSRKINLEPIPRNPRQLLSEAISTMKFPENVAIIDLTREEPEFNADPQMMKRVFVNLINNAIDAMPSGGEITVDSREAGDGIEFLVSDSGEGVPVEIREKIWDPLFTTKAKGMGFGLSICKRIVEAHGGSINMETETGKGTTFIVRLPFKMEH